MRYSIIITAWKEPETIKETFTRILDEKWGNSLENMEIVLVSPDEETYFAALEIVQKYGFQNFIYAQDSNKGKPAALNLAVSKANGAILILTDGDVILGKNSLRPLIEGFSDNTIGGVTGRPVSLDSKNDIFGYWGNLLAEGAHVKRARSFEKKGFYFMSGYLCAIRKYEGLKFPEDTLVDDAWISVELIKRDMKIAYSSNSLVYIKYPRNFSDWIKQKKRSLGGYTQLKESQKEAFANYEVLQSQNRNIINEIKYTFFPFQYASNLKEFFYSLALFPARLYLWLVIFYEQKVKKKSFKETWVRIESTK
jgi:poly-beta-1,6-N-acetyl-D-glucosamine synthase